MNTRETLDRIIKELPSKTSFYISNRNRGLSE